MIQPNLKLSERIFNGSRYQFLVLNRDETRLFQSDTPYLVISITDPDKPEAEIAESPLLKSILRLSFDDVGKPSQFVSDSANVSMNNADAKRILSFVKEHSAKVKLIVCHCEQGVSRSAAVAAALSHILQKDDSFPIQNYWANRWVYNLIVDNSNVLQEFSE